MFKESVNLSNLKKKKVAIPKLFCICLPLKIELRSSILSILNIDTHKLI